MIKAAVAVPLADMTKLGKQWASHGNAIIISIIDPDLPETVVFEEDTDDIITLKFHDIQPAPCIRLLSCSTMTPCTTEQATQIVDFLMKHHASEREVTLICNCTLGRCRSGAVVAFAQMICELDEDAFWRANPAIDPNMWVTDILSSVYLNRIKYATKEI